MTSVISRFYSAVTGLMQSLKSLLICLLCLCAMNMEVDAQQILIGEIDPGPYGAGSTVTVPLAVNGSVQKGSRFELYLSDNAGNFDSSNPIGVFDSHFATFVNGTIPATVMAGTYKLKVALVNPAGEVISPADQPEINILQMEGPEIKATLTESYRILLEDKIWGYNASGKEGNTITVKNLSTDVTEIGGTLINDYRPETPVFNFTFQSSNLQELSLSIAYYTLRLRAVKNGVISTKSFVVLNSTYNLSWQSSGSQSACIPAVDDGSDDSDENQQIVYSVNTSADNNTSIRTNYPGLVYRIDWGDNGPKEYVTQNELIESQGYVKHRYSETSCGKSVISIDPPVYNAYQANISIEAPFNVSSMPITTYPKVFMSPVADFEVPEGRGCVNEDITFQNLSIPGQSENVAGDCTFETSYTWYYKKSTETAWQICSDASDLVWKFSGTGTYNIKLVASNSTCPPSEKVHDICIEDNPEPDFDLVQSSDCAPAEITVINKTNTGDLCEVAWQWQVLDSASAQVTTDGINFLTPGTEAVPGIRVDKPGSYILRLSVISSCEVATLDKPFTVAGPLTVALPDATQKYCREIPAIIDFGEDAPHVPVYNGYGKDKKYTWTISGGNYSFVGGTSEKSAFPVIRFEEAADYQVMVSFQNECGDPVNDTQNIIFYADEIVVEAGDDDVVCDNVPEGRAEVPAHTTYQLHGNIPQPHETGKWTFVSGPGSYTFDDDSKPGAVVSKLEPGTYVFRWTISNPGGCAESDEMTLTVYERPRGGSVSGPARVCTGGSGTLTLSEYLGQISGWQWSADGSVWNDVVDSSTDHYHFSELPSTTFFRVKVMSDGVAYGCSQPVYSEVFRIDTDPLSVGGTASGAQTWCGIAVSGEIVLAGQTGHVIAWQRSEDGYNWISETSSANPYYYSNITATTWFRAVVKSGDCYIAESAPVAITIISAPTDPQAGSDVLLCAGETTRRLDGNQPASGTGEWSQISGPAVTFDDVHKYDALVSGLEKGQRYTFAWTISNGICESKKDMVVVDVLSDMVNTIKASRTISCKDEAVALSTGLLTGGDIPGVVSPAYTFQWEQSVSATGPWQNVPGGNVENITVHPSATTWFRRKVQSHNSCESVSPPIEITINASTPEADAGDDVTLCGKNSYRLTGNEPGPGFTGTWTVADPAGTLTFIPDVHTPDAEIQGLEAGKRYELRWTIAGISPCADQSDQVTITVRKPVTVASAGADKHICLNKDISNDHITLEGSEPDPQNGESGIWTKLSGPSGEVFADASKHNTVVSGLKPGEYVFEWKISSDASVTETSCNVSASQVKISVTSYPVAGVISGGNISVCEGTAPGQLVLGGYSSGDLLQWQSSADGTHFDDIAGAVSDIWPPGVLAATTWFRVKVSQADGCLASEITVPVKIQVDLPTVEGSLASSVTSVCTGNNNGSVTLAGHRGVIVRWEMSTDNGLSWSPVGSTANPLVFSDLNTSAGFRAVVQNGSCTVKETTPVFIEVLPNVTQAIAGSDQYLCNATAFYLQGNTPEAGTGMWNLEDGPMVTIDDPANPGSKVSGLLPGKAYVFRWTISNGICDPSVSRVTVYNYAPLTNQIAGTTTVCSGQATIIAGQQPSGGDGTYTFQWETSTDGQVWVTEPGQNQPDLTRVFTGSLYVRRIVRSGPCMLESEPVLVTVQPPLENNTISGEQVLCTGDPAAVITGSTPSGGDGQFFYRWEKSADGISWTEIPGENTAGLQPPVLTETTWYRRIVSTALCDGDQKSVSNAVRIIVHPLAKAEFSASAQRSCVPFDLSSVISLVPYDDRNADYEWFAGGVSLGKGKAFPGYIIAGDGELVTIRLEVTSKYGCASDSHELEFATVKNVVASFTKDQVKGCGPLPVHFTNTSSPLNGGTYFWDFGNGQTFNGEQPGPVVFEPHPQHRDTTYIITLKASSGCNDTEFIDSVLVRPMPDAVFSPDKVRGCSPLEITFTNQSTGTPNTYTFDFGDGHSQVTTDNAPVTHTFYTAKTDTITVSLTAENECGWDTVSYNIVVYPNTVTSELVVDGDRKMGCAPFTVKFDNNSTGANLFYWDFRDGATLTTSDAPGSVTHTFTEAGTYEVSLLATNGCASATTTETITVYALPDAGFTLSDGMHCANDLISFSSRLQSQASYHWNFNDGTTSDEANPVHAFQRAGKYRVSLTVLESHPDGSVCSNNFIREVEVLPLPVALFTSNSASLNCTPFRLSVSSTPENAASVSWDFGDPGSPDNSSLGYSAAHVYTKAGTYSVMQIAYNEAGCMDTLVRQIRVTGRPQAAFTASDTLICASKATIGFVNQTIYEGADAVAYGWYVDNRPVASSKDLNYLFNVSPGDVLPRVFEVKLIAVNALGCPDTAVHHIRFNPSPEADFELTESTGCPPFRLSVQNKSRFAGRYTWYLDGEPVSSAETPSDIVLSEPDKTWSLELVADNDYGCASSRISKTVTTYARPHAFFTLADSVSCNGRLDIAITNSSTGATRYVWDFGDNSALSAEMTPLHRYGQPGVYSLKLIAFNNYCSDTLVRTVRIAAVPQAVFDADVTEGCTQINVRFRNLSLNATDYLWDFGDGTFSTSKDPLHSFSYIRSPYTVKLTAYGEFGCEESVVQLNYIRVAAPPEADFEALPDSVIQIPEYTFRFSNQSRGNPLRYQWSFGDGKTSEEENPSHTYINGGSYPVRLIVTNAEGCTDTLSRTVTIEGVPGYLYVPNGFEPGNVKPDLKFFMPKGTGIARYSVKVFNKWGQMVWQSDKLDEKGSPAEGWDGTMAGNPAPQGVYVWEISATFIDGTEWKGMKYPSGSRQKAGPLHLIR